jgi:hypothetical protein
VNSVVLLTRSFVQVGPAIKEDYPRRCISPLAAGQSGVTFEITLDTPQANQMLTRSIANTFVLLATTSLCLHAQRGNSPFPGGENPDGSLRPSARLSRLFTQDAYTEYALLAPGTDQFRIRFFTENARAGAVDLVNETRGGSEGTDIEVYDPRTGKPLPFTYEETQGGHAIRAKFPFPVPQGGIGRVLIYKTYKDSRTYQTYNEANAAFNIEPGDISWVRSLSGYRLGVILPPGYAFLSSNVAAQMSTTQDGRLKLHFANPSGQSNPVTIHARKTATQFAPTNFTDVFFDDVKTLYDLGAPESHAMKVQQIYTEFRKGATPTLPLLGYAALTDVKVTDLDTAKPLVLGTGQGPRATVTLELPIVEEKQSAHLQVDGTLSDPKYTAANGTLTFDRTLKGLRNTVLLPAGWQVASVSQSATVGTYQGRQFVALINLNGENAYAVRITARKE